MRARRWLASISVASLVAAIASGCSAMPTQSGEHGEESGDNLGTVAQALNSGFRLPFKCGFNVTVTQGNNSPFSHNGVSAYGFDFGVPLNTELVAARAGVVSHARNDVKPGNPCYSGGGPGCASTLNYVTVKHGDGTSTVYAHLNATSVTVGQTVAQGQRVGFSGGTGYSTGPHTHLQRQQSCADFYCQSVPMSFDDVAGNGVPVAGQAVKSQNSCAGVDCALGDGHYCGGNGVKGDKSTLFFCTAGTPAKVESCTYGCKAMPPGIDDRCATEAEAPPDSGADAASDAAPPPPPPKVTEPPASSAAPSSDTTGAPAPLAEEPPAESSSSCSVTGGPTRGAVTTSARSRASVFAAFGLVGALVVAARRRRRAAR